MYTTQAIYSSAKVIMMGSLKKMIPGQGYIIKSAKGANIQYPVLSKSTTQYPEIPEWKCENNVYEYSMSMTVVLEFDGRELADSTIILAAFSGSECRGLTRMQYLAGVDRYVGFLNIYSNTVNSDSISFGIYEPGEDKKRDVTNKIPFTSDDHVGTIESPFTLKAEGIGDELVPDVFYLNQNYPNPFNPLTTIEYGIPKDENVIIRIYDILGQLVATLVDEQQKAHRYTITFNANDYRMASGIYFYQLKAGAYIQNRKFVFIK